MAAKVPASLVGTLLLSPAGVHDRPFAKAVILVLDREESGITLGVVLNRPTEQRAIEVAAMAPFFLPDAQAPAFWGGPMGKDSLILAELSDTEGLEWFHLGIEHRRPMPLPGVGMVALAEHPDALQGRIQRARLFTGICVWGRNQLEQEVERGEWLLSPATTDDIFTDSPETLWQRQASGQP